MNDILLDRDEMLLSIIREHLSDDHYQTFVLGCIIRLYEGNLALVKTLPE